MNRKALVSTLAVTIALMFVGATGVMANDVSVFCGKPQICTLWGGKTIDVGTVTVSNDEENLYVTYDTSGDWWLTEVHLYVLENEPTKRLTPGQAPYKSGNISYTKTYTFTVPIPAWVQECDIDQSPVWLQAHAAVVKKVDGVVVQDETAYGSCNGVEQPGKGAWYGNINYVVQCCEEVPPSCHEFKGETAWADGSRYVDKGNWATYTQYEGGASVALYAGQTIDVGTVTFSAPDNGMVTITINLTGDWVFNPESPENVKIQDYAEAPSGNPSPGLFNYKFLASSQSWSDKVPVNNFYGVHVDVGYWAEVECPVE